MLVLRESAVVLPIGIVDGLEARSQRIVET